MKTKKKKKIIIISILIAIVIAVVIGIIVIIMCNKNVNNYQTHPDIEKRVNKLFRNDYLYHYFMYGDVKIGEGTLESDGQTYYIVNDPDIISLSQFYNIVNDTFIYSMVNTLLSVEEKNEYLDVDGKLYVKKMENPCEDIVEFDLSSISYGYSEDKIRIIYDRRPTILFNEDGIWKLEGDLYYCETPSN